MGEIIVIHVGQCGINLGLKFWETLTEEHGISVTGNVIATNSEQTENITVFFKQGGRGYIPRSVFVDLEADAINPINESPLSPLFRSDNLIFGDKGTTSNWAKGYCTDGQELLDSTLTAINREVAECTNLQGFILTHSLGGGTGSGMGSLIISHLRESYPDKVIATFSVFSSPAICDVVTEPYNAALSVNYLSKYADLVFCLDNMALRDFYLHHSRVAEPTYEDLNSIIVAALSNVTAPLRFSSKDGNSLATLRDMVSQFVPPANDSNREDGIPPKSPLIFLSTRMKSVGSNTPLSYSSRRDLASDSTYNRDYGLATDPRHGVSISMAGICRDQHPQEQISSSDWLSSLFLWKTTHQYKEFVNKVSTVSLSVPQKGTSVGITVLDNNTSIKELLERVAMDFSAMFRRKAYLHLYLNEGMDEEEFKEAESLLNEVISKYTEAEELIRQQNLTSEETSEDMEE